MSSVCFPGSDEEGIRIVRQRRPGLPGTGPRPGGLPRRRFHICWWTFISHCSHSSLSSVASSWRTGPVSKRGILSGITVSLCLRVLRRQRSQRRQLWWLKNGRPAPRRHHHLHHHPPPRGNNIVGCNNVGPCVLYCSLWSGQQSGIYDGRGCRTGPRPPLSLHFHSLLVQTNFIHRPGAVGGWCRWPLII